MFGGVSCCEGFEAFHFGTPVHLQDSDELMPMTDWTSPLARLTTMNVSTTGLLVTVVIPSFRQT